MIRNGDGSIQNTVLKILHKNKADKATIDRWEKKCNPEMAQRFERLMTEIKNLDKVLSTDGLTTPLKMPVTEKHSASKRFEFDEGKDTKSKASFDDA